MVETQEIKLSKLIPVKKNAGMLEVPCIPTGAVARAIRQVYENHVRQNYGGNQLLLDALQYNERKDIQTHSNFFALNVLGQALRAENPAIDVTSRADLLEREVEELAKGVYIDAQDALVLRGANKFRDERDKLIFEQLKAHVDNLKTPVLLEGLQVVNASGEGYGLRVIPTKSFSYTHDENKFGQKAGWLQSDYAISGLYRGGFDLRASRFLADAVEDGRAVLVSRVASAPNLERVLDDSARNELLRGVNSIRQAADAMTVLVNKTPSN